MNLLELLLFCKDKLMDSGMELMQAEFEAECIVLFCAKCERSKLFFSDSCVDESVLEQANEIVRQRTTGVPLQYLIGEWDFCGYTFAVGKGVLIPRPETEELADLAICTIRENNLKTIFDLCAGNGCIGLSIAKDVPECTVYLIEKYPIPISYIKKNAEQLEISNIKIISDDVRAPAHLDELPEADLIVSNPPYIMESDIPFLQKEVQAEPWEALNGGEDGLLFYRSILNNWMDKLKNSGWLYFECGEEQPQSIVELSKPFAFSDMQIVKDMYEIERFVVLKK